MDKYVSVPEKTLADFKDKNLNSIPEQKPLNLELMGRTKRELVQIDNEILSLEDRKFYLDGQLAQLKPDVQVISSRGERILSPEDRLKSLKMEYLAIMLSRYSKSLSIRHSLFVGWVRPRGRNPPIDLGPVLSPVEGPVPSRAEGPVPSRAEGPVLSSVEGLTHHRWVSLRSTHPTMSVHSNAEWNYSVKHPDVINARQEIASLKIDAGDAGGGLDLAKHLTRLDGEFATLRKKYSEIHPDIVNLKNQILASDEELKKVQTARAIRDIGTRQPENPAYITLQARRDVAIQDLRALRQHREEIKGKLTEYENRLLQTPRVGRQYLELVRDYDNATAHYRELRAKAMKAEVAEQLEKSRKGERFSVIEPPVLPKNRSSRTGRPLLFLVRCWPSREDSVTCC